MLLWALREGLRRLCWTKIFIFKRAGGTGGSDLDGTISIIYDAARQEEKLLIRELSRRGASVRPVNLDDVELGLDGPPERLGLAVMRPVSHMKAILIARMLNITGIPTINSGGESMELSWNKALSLAVLRRAGGLPVTPSVLVMGGRSQGGRGLPGDPEANTGIVGGQDGQHGLEQGRAIADIEA